MKLFRGQLAAFEIKASFGLGRYERRLHVDDVCVSLWRRPSCGRCSLAVLKCPAFAGRRQENGIDFPAMQGSVDIEPAAAHWSSRDKQSVVTRPADLGHCKNQARNVLRLGAAQAFARSAPATYTHNAG